MNRKPIERKGTTFPMSAPRMPAVPLPKSASRPSVARGQTTGAINHSLPEALQMKIPAGAAPPKQQVFQRPNPSISSVPKRKATPYPIRQDSKLTAPWNAARPPLSSSQTSSSGPTTALIPTRTQQQPQPVSRTKKSFRSIFKMKKLKSKEPHTAGTPKLSTSLGPTAGSPAKTKTKNEKAHVKEGKQSKSNKQAEKAQLENAKALRAKSRHDFMQYRDWKIPPRPFWHTPGESTHVSSPAMVNKSRGTKHHLAENTRHTHHSPPPPAYTTRSPPPAAHTSHTQPRTAPRLHPTQEPVPVLPISQLQLFESHLSHLFRAHRWVLVSLLPFAMFMLDRRDGTGLDRVRVSYEKVKVAKRGRMAKWWVRVERGVEWVPGGKAGSGEWRGELWFEGRCKDPE